MHPSLKRQTVLIPRSGVRIPHPPPTTYLTTVPEFLCLRNAEFSRKSSRFFAVVHHQIERQFRLPFACGGRLVPLLCSGRSRAGVRFSCLPPFQSRHS